MFQNLVPTYIFTTHLSCDTTWISAKSWKGNIDLKLRGIAPDLLQLIIALEFSDEDLQYEITPLPIPI